MRKTILTVIFLISSYGVGLTAEGDNIQHIVNNIDFLQVGIGGNYSTDTIPSICFKHTDSGYIYCYEGTMDKVKALSAVVMYAKSFGYGINVYGKETANANVFLIGNLRINF